MRKGFLPCLLHFCRIQLLTRNVMDFRDALYTVLLHIRGDDRYAVRREKKSGLRKSKGVRVMRSRPGNNLAVPRQPRVAATCLQQVHFFRAPNRQSSICASAAHACKPMLRSLIRAAASPRMGSEISYCPIQMGRIASER